VSNNVITCPFCLKEHNLDSLENHRNGGKMCERDEVSGAIPRSYINHYLNGVPVIPLLLAGYRGCGKTHYLSSLIHSCFDLVPPSWFSMRALNQDTIDTIQQDYIPSLINGFFLPPTDALKEPLMIELSIAKRSILQPARKVVLLLFDVPGGFFEDETAIHQTMGSFISGVINIALLVDLPSIERKMQESYPADLQIFGLVNKLINALENIQVDSKEKNIIVCFTKMDEFWDLPYAEDDFGSIAVKPLSINKDISMGSYISEMYKSSFDMEKVIGQRYKNFYGLIKEYFAGYFFVKSSNIGSQVNQNENTFQSFHPMGVIDPAFWLLREGYII
jgi:GTPase SAR1 family protein